MPKVVSIQKMIAIEQAQCSLGISLDTLMRTAGAELARVVSTYSKVSRSSRRAVALVGSGNNGGDALVAVSILAQAGWHCTALLVSDRKPDDILIAEAKLADCEILDVSTGILGSFTDSPVVIDGILGTGFKLPLREKLADLFKDLTALIQKNNCEVFAVDCPSGVDCDSGEAAVTAIPADVTVCMAAVKQGLLKDPAAGLAGRIMTVDIGVTEDNPEWQMALDEVLDARTILELLPDREAYSHKGTYGKVLVCGGCIQYPGAPVLSAMGAYSIGAGLVRIAGTEVTQIAFAGQLPEAVWSRLPEASGYLCAKSATEFEKQCVNQNVVVFGPGLGQAGSTAEFAAEALKTFGGDRFRSKGTRVVIDADGLRQIAKIDRWHAELPAGSVITPHPGEFAGISVDLGLTSSDRTLIAKIAAKAWHCVVVLKGAYTVIAAPDGRSMVIAIATSALAKAGTGDVLSGMIAGLMAQGAGSYEAAMVGAGLHAMAGLEAADELKSDRSVMASDLRYYVGVVISLLPELAEAPGLLGI